MKQLLVMIALSTLSLSVFAVKPCEELRGEIAAKIDAKGVKDYSLEVVAASDVGDQKVVGSCEGGSKKIVYARK